MTTETVSTDLVIDQALKGTIARAGSLKDIAAALDVHVAPAPVFTNVATWPKPVTMTEEAKQAIDALPVVFNRVMPTEPKILDDKEMVDLFEEREILRDALAPLSARDEVIKEIVRHHMDLVAEQSNIAIPKDIVRNGQVIATATTRDSKGHYILASKGNPEQAEIPGTNQAWSREYKQGGVSFNFAAGDLLAMYEEGEITREQYLAMTRETRVFDEAKTMEAVRKDPETYLPIFQRVAVRSSESTSITVRKAK
jgi:hypothetical protein